MQPRLLILFVPGILFAANWVAPKTPDGQPDIQGTWTNATITPFERPDELANKPVLTPEEAAALEKRAADNRVDRPPKAGDVGSYNQVWFDSGTKVLSTHQTALVVDPPDGRVPITPAAAAKRDYNAAHNSDSWEYMSVWDRCITRGMPAGMFPAGYNNAYQILQTPGYVVILYEMIHETRIIPLDDGRPHVSSDIPLVERRRFARALGRPDAGGGHHELQQQGLYRHQRGNQSDQRHSAERGIACRGAIHARQPGHHQLRSQHR